MMRIRRIFGVLALVFLLCQGVVADEKIKVACIGDSITAGVGAGKKSSYPAQLQNRLGDQYTVLNLGKKGVRMKRYLKLKRGALEEFQPDVVTIKLGTNDTRDRNFDPEKDNKEWFNKSFSDAAANLITFLQGLESKPKIYVCLPVPVFKENKWTISDKAMVEDVIPSLKKVAAEKKVAVIDLYTPCKDEGENVPDGVHPNEKVYAIIADVIAKEIKAK